MKKLGTFQRNIWMRYIDCKERTKRKIEFPVKKYITTDDEKLILFILRNSSIVERDNERAYSRVVDAINLICRQLCPGQWCTRTHCKYYSSHNAYNCNKTRPAVCKEYKTYIEKQEAKKKGINDKTSEV